MVQQRFHNCNNKSHMLSKSCRLLVRILQCIRCKNRLELKLELVHRLHKIKCLVHNSSRWCQEMEFQLRYKQ